MLNLAPFSAFTFVSQKPPMLAISVGRKGDDYMDTAHNILDTEEYVIHIADTPLMNAVHESRLHSRAAPTLSASRAAGRSRPSTRDSSSSSARVVVTFRTSRPGRIFSG